MVLSLIKVISLLNISFICPLDWHTCYFFLWICIAECFVEMKNILDAGDGRYDFLVHGLDYLIEEELFQKMFADSNSLFRF